MTRIWIGKSTLKLITMSPPISLIQEDLSAPAQQVIGDVRDLIVIYLFLPSFTPLLVLF